MLTNVKDVTIIAQTMRDVITRLVASLVCVKMAIAEWMTLDLVKVCLQFYGMYSLLHSSVYTQPPLTALDVNECLDEALNNCSNSSHRECKDTPGSFMCPCKSGFEENGVDECEGELSLKAMVESLYQG